MIAYHIYWVDLDKCEANILAAYRTRDEATNGYHRMMSRTDKPVGIDVIPLDEGTDDSYFFEGPALRDS